MVSIIPADVTLKPYRRGTQFPEITHASRALGVSRTTLYRVLKGQHPDRQNLQVRYAAYLREVAATIKREIAQS